MPKLRTNLFSIGGPTDRGMVTLNKRDGCSLIDDDGKMKEVITKYRSCKLYKLNIQAVGTSSDLSQSRAFLTNLQCSKDEVFVDTTQQVLSFEQ